MLRNAEPNFDSARKGRDLLDVAALPGIAVPDVPSMSAAKPSVVGSGPMCIAGKSFPAR